jgi:hypothetical protein
MQPNNQATPEQLAALRAFAARNGRSWKRRLCELFFAGREIEEPEGPLLRQVRNTLGPSGVWKVKLGDPAK